MVVNRRSKIEESLIDANGTEESSENSESGVQESTIGGSKNEEPMVEDCPSGMEEYR